jgi:hypothetical protein
MSKSSKIAKDTVKTKIDIMIENGRKEITTQKELEKYLSGSPISYIDINNTFKSGGFLLKTMDKYFIYVTPDFLLKKRVYFKNVSKMWIGDVYSIKNDLISLTETSQKKTNFPVKINNIIIYYGRSNFDKKRFMNTVRYEKIVQWYKYFIDPNYDPKTDSLKMDKTQLLQILKKYNISKEKLNNILKHLTYFKENINTTIPEKFGDKMDMQISIEIIFDGKKYDISFYTDFSCNSGHWHWDDEWQAEVDDEPQNILRGAVCEYLDKNYPQ